MKVDGCAVRSNAGGDNMDMGVFRVLVLVYQEGLLAEANTVHIVKGEPL